MEFHVESEGMSDFTARFRAIREFREAIEDLLQRAGFSATAYMHLHVPYHTGALSSAINYSDSRYAPGAAGGGGFYEVNVGVDEAIAPHARHVINGSGLYDEASPHLIYPRSKSAMVFEQHGQRIFTAYTRGQRPRREWFEDAQELASDIIAQGIQSLSYRTT
jgi:hypothetical protein